MKDQRGRDAGATSDELLEPLGAIMRPRVFVTRPLPTPTLDLLRAGCEVELHPEDSPVAPAQLAEICGAHQIEGLVVCGARVTEQVVEGATHLRVVSNVGVGYDNVDVAACTRRQIPVTNTAGVLEETTADLAFALLMAVARRVVEGDRYVREGRWQQWQWSLLWGADIHHQTLGIYGLGNIGRAMARRGRGFSMRVIYHSRRRVDAAVETELGATFVDRDTLFRESDFVSLHVPLTPETHHLVADRELSLMKPTAFLINTTRGKVVDEEALAAALESHRIAGAGLDVFEQEPRVHPALPDLQNVVLAPHIGSATMATRSRMAALAAENLLAALAGRRPPNVVNPEVYS